MSTLELSQLTVDLTKLLDEVFGFNFNCPIDTQLGNQNKLYKAWGIPRGQRRGLITPNDNLLIVIGEPFDVQLWSNNDPPFKLGWLLLLSFQRQYNSAIADAEFQPGIKFFFKRDNFYFQVVAPSSKVWTYVGGDMGMEVSSIHSVPDAISGEQSLFASSISSISSLREKWGIPYAQACDVLTVVDSIPRDYQMLVRTVLEWIMENAPTS